MGGKRKNKETNEKKEKINKMAVFWVATPCSLVEVYQRFRGQRRPDDGGSKDL
jgi:hypothetical protein